MKPTKLQVEVLHAQLKRRVDALLAIWDKKHPEPKVAPVTAEEALAEMERKGNREETRQHLLFLLGESLCGDYGDRPLPPSVERLRDARAAPRKAWAETRAGYLAELEARGNDIIESAILSGDLEDVGRALASLNP